MRGRCRFLLSALVLLGASWVSGFSQEKAGPEPLEPEPAAPERLGKLTLALDPGWHAGVVRKVFFTPDGQQIISVATDHVIRIWNAMTGEMTKVLYPPGHGGLYAADLSADGKRLAVASRYLDGEKLSYVVLVLALPEGRIERVLKGSTQDIKSLAISADGKWVAASGSLQGQLRIWELDREDPGRVLRKAGFAGLAFSPDGKRLACVSSKGEIIDLATGTEVAKFKGGRTVAWSPDGKMLATLFSSKEEGGGIRLLDADGQQIRQIDQRGIGYKLSFSKNGRFLLATADIYDVATGEELSKNFKKSRIIATGHMDSALSPDASLAVTAGHGAAVWKTQNAAIVKEIVLSRWMPYGGQEARWSADGKAIAWSKLPNAPSFQLGELRLGTTLADGVGPTLRQGEWTIDATPAQFRVLKAGRQISQVRMGANRPLTFFGKHQIAAADASGRLLLFDGETGKEVGKLGDRQPPITSVAASPDGRLLLTIAAASGQRLRIWNPQRQDKPLLTLYCRGGDWVAWTPEGYYAASPGGERLIGWTVDNGMGQLASFYPADRFRKQMYRPDVIKLLVEKGNIQDAVRSANAALKDPGVVEGVADLNKLLPPRVELLLDQQDLPNVKLKVRATAAVKEQPVAALRLLVDGRPWSDATSVRYAAPVSKADAEWTIVLPPGKHQLTVLARCPDSSSKSNTVEVAVADPAKQHTLHVLAVGVSDYEDATLKLAFAAKDARDLAAGFQKACKGELYHEVTSQVLVDAASRKVAILSRLSALRKQAKPNDLVVVYFAGHGVKQKDKFYLLPVEAKTDDLAKTALSGDELRKALGEFPCQVLLMLDACHSSAGLKNFRPAVDDITRNLTDDDCGVAVLCAAMAHEKALEKEGNGLFTRAIIDGLNRGEGVPYNHFNHLLYVHHLHSYVFDRVSHQSGDRQHPFLSLPWVVESFPVAQFAAR